MPGLLDRIFGVQDASPADIDAVLGKTVAPAPVIDPFAPVSDADRANSTLNAILTNADIGRTPDIAYRSTLLPISVTSAGQVVPDGHSGMVYGTSQVLGDLPQLGRQLANEPVMTTDPSGAITDTSGVQGADTMDALNAAATIGAGGYASPKPDGSIGMFGGRLAKTADLDAHDLALARDTLKGMPGYENVDRASIFQDTGWLPGVDGSVRFEIPDDGSTFWPGGSTVGETLNHPALFAAYPNLSDMPLKTMALPEGELGAFGGDHIRLSDTLSPGEAHATLLHELQHAIQAQEGFARGGNALALAGGMDAYNRLAGEVEARNVETRMRMPDDLRAAIPPWSTESVRPEQQLVTAPSILDAYFARGQTLSSQAPPLLPSSSGQPQREQPTMADGLFYDLIPAAPAQASSASSGDSAPSSSSSPSPHPLFDDLVPQQPGVSFATQADGAPLGLRNVPTAKDDPIYHGAVPIAQAPDQGATTAFGSGVGGVPIFGPMIEGGLQKAAAYGRSLAHGTSYDVELQHVQDMVDAARQQHPTAAFAGDLTGAAAAMAPVIASAPEVFGAGPGGLSAGKVGAGALSGAGVGAADAAVRSDGDLDAIGFGAGAGLVAGAAGPAIGAGLGRLGHAAAGLYGRLAAPNPGVSRPAADIMTRVLANDGRLGPEGLQAIGDAGPRAMLVDASPGLSGVLDASLQHGGPGTAVARQAIDARAAGAGQDINTALDQAFGPAQGIYTTEDGIRVGSAAARQQAYDAAYASPIDYTTPAGRSVENIMASRVPPGIIARAQSQMRVDGALPPQQSMAHIANDGTVTYQAMPDVRFVDYVTRSLNDVARAGDGQGALGGNTAEGRSYGQLAQDLRGALRSAVPAYGDALDTAAQPIDARNALQFGASMLSPSVPRDVVSGTIDGMTPPELAQVRGGVRAHIADTLGNVQRTITDPNVDARQTMAAVKMLSSDAANDKLGMLLGPNEASSITTALDQAGQSLNLRASAARNSATAARLNTNQTIQDATEPGMLKQAIASGGPLKATRPVAQYILGTRPQDIGVRQDALYGELASALTSPASSGGSGVFSGLMRGQQARDAAAGIAGAIPYDTLSQAGMLALLPPLQSRSQ